VAAEVPLIFRMQGWATVAAARMIIAAAAEMLVALRAAGQCPY